MQIPKFKHTVSPSMSGAYSTPQLQKDRPVMTAPQYDTRNFLSDPSAGRRNMQLEVQAVLDQAKPLAALADGGNLIAKTLFEQESQQQLTTANTDFRLTVEDALSNLKNQKVARTVRSMDGKTGQFDIVYEPVHETSYSTFNESIIDARDKIAKRLNRPAREAFLKGTVNYVADALSQAKSANYKQQLAYLQGMAYKEIRSQVDLRGVSQVEDTQWINNAMDPMTLAKALETRRREISNEHYKLRVIKAGTEDELDEIKLELIRFGATGNFNTVEGGYELEINAHRDYLNANDIESLASTIRSKKNDLLEQNKRVRAEELDSISDSIHANFDNWDLSNIEDLRLKGSTTVDGEKFVVSQLRTEDFDKLAKRWATASSGNVVSDPDTVRQIVENIEDYATDAGIDEIWNDPTLTNEKKQELVGEAKKAKIKLNLWMKEDHPGGPSGKEAMRRLKGHFGIYDDQGSFFTSFESQSSAMKVRGEYENARQALWNYVDGFVEEPLEKPAKALEWVNNFLSALRLSEQTGPASTSLSVDGSAAAQEFNLTDQQRERFETWQMSAQGRDKNGNVYTLERIRDMPESAVRRELVKELNAMEIYIDGGEQESLKDKCTRTGKSLEECMEDEPTTPPLYRRFQILRN